MADAPITARPHVFYIRPAPGWLDLLYKEVTEKVKTPLQKYKFEPKVTQLKGTVKLHRCDWRQGLEIMLRLNTAHDVEWMILESKCTKWTEVEAILNRVPWASIIADRTQPVHVTAEVSRGFTSASGKLREQFCKSAGLTHVSEGGIFRFKIELRSDFLRVSVSLCGEPLYKRNYKAQLYATAPLPEHQAAACIEWVRELVPPEEPIRTVFVPFAGSGTLGFESLLVLSGSGPGAFSRKFSCDLFPCTPEATMRFFRKKLKEQLKESNHPELIFNELNSEALLALKANSGSFLETYRCQILEGDLFTIKPSFSKEGTVLILLNPPFGNRLAKHSSVSSLYSRLGKYFRALSESNPRAMVGGCLCPDTSSWRSFLAELNAFQTETHHFTHGGKEMRLVRWKTKK